MCENAPGIAPQRTPWLPATNPTTTVRCSFNKAMPNWLQGDARHSHWGFELFCFLIHDMRVSRLPCSCWAVAPTQLTKQPTVSGGQGVTRRASEMGTMASCSPWSKFVTMLPAPLGSPFPENGYQAAGSPSPKMATRLPAAGGH